MLLFSLFLLYKLITNYLEKEYNNSSEKISKSIEKIIKNPSELSNFSKEIKDNLKPYLSTWALTKVLSLTLLLIATVLGGIIAIQQNKLMSTQNELFNVQNNRIDDQSELIKNQNILLAKQTRPYIAINGLSDLKTTILKIYNAPAYVDSMIIEYHIKEFGNHPFKLTDRQVETDFTLYADGKKQSLLKISTNILTEQLLNEVKINNKRLMRKTTVFYKNLSDEIGNKKEIQSQYMIEKIEFLSKKTGKWYIKKQNDLN